jgi:hypothetical protein
MVAPCFQSIRVSLAQSLTARKFHGIEYILIYRSTKGLQEIPLFPPLPKGDEGGFFPRMFFADPHAMPNIFGLSVGFTPSMDIRFFEC